ncbi:hypothetical protein ACFLX5_05065 [Chloroflexota bacterium]
MGYKVCRGQPNMAVRDVIMLPARVGIVEMFTCERDEEGGEKVSVDRSELLWHGTRI